MNTIKTISLQMLDTISEKPTWFETLFGFKEGDHDYNKTMLYPIPESNTIKSLANNKVFHIGRFSTPSLRSLRKSSIETKTQANIGKTTYEYRAINDILELHHQNPGATFQVASQFNCLEFANPNMTPEDGISRYDCDYTQGPACALACAAGTAFRNLGQSFDKQLNNLCELETLLPGYWTVKNGYVKSDSSKINQLNQILENSICKSEQVRREMLDSIRIGYHEKVGVNFSKRFELLEQDIRVTQCYCSAISCAYSGISNKLWEPLARIVLEANYEAVVWSAVISNSSDVFLTFLGGGAFSNEQTWIIDAIARAIAIAKKNNLKLNFVICFYMDIDEEVIDMIEEAIVRWNKKME